MAVTLSNVTRALVFLPATFLFLNHIASKLNVSKKELFSLIILEHDGFDYFVLAGILVYLFAAGVTAAVRGKLENETQPGTCKFLLTKMHCYGPPPSLSTPL